jgi:hypothetical protein
MRRKYKSMLGSGSNEENLEKLKSFFNSSVMEAPNKQVSPSKLHFRSSSVGLESSTKLQKSSKIILPSASKQKQYIRLETKHQINKFFNSPDSGRKAHQITRQKDAKKEDLNTSGVHSISSQNGEDKEEHGSKRDFKIKTKQKKVFKKLNYHSRVLDNSQFLDLTLHESNTDGLTNRGYAESKILEEIQEAPQILRGVS